MTSIEIRILGPACIEDYHAHLLRLDSSDRALRFVTGNDERGVDGHCLRLLSAQAVLIGAFADGILRAAVEIVPDRTGRHAEAVLTAESGDTPPAALPLLIGRLVDEARSYRLGEVRLYGLDNPVPAERAALSDDVEVEIGSPIVLRFRQPKAMKPGASAQSHVAA